MLHPFVSPFAKRNEACRAIEEMCKQGVIEPSRSPWSSPVVLVKKSGGWRFCVDYRKLNNVTRKDSYLLPRIDESIEALSGAKLFSPHWIRRVATGRLSWTLGTRRRLLFLLGMVFGSSLLCRLDWLMHQLHSRDLWSRC